MAALASWTPRLVGFFWCNVWGPSGPFLGLFGHGLQLGGAGDWQPRALAYRTASTEQRIVQFLLDYFMVMPKYHWGSDSYI